MSHFKRRGVGVHTEHQAIDGQVDGGLQAVVQADADGALPLMRTPRPVQ